MPSHSMKHRHIESNEYTLAAIDDVISRGDNMDWLELRDAIQHDVLVAKRARQLCESYNTSDDIRFQFWVKYLNYYGLAHE